MKFFESLVVDIIVTIGNDGSRKVAGRAIGQVGDGGIDGIFKEDKWVILRILSQLLQTILQTERIDELLHKRRSNSYA
ncbi:MAG TPA: hypothetical protein VEH81_09565 [Ktedonobacteraceae bacterium]|nr:hypothetical protein [Ktedonobacteraceae bacterium]